MTKNYRYKVCDVEHPGDYESFATAIREGGGIINFIEWTEVGEDAIIHFSAYSKDIDIIKSRLQELL